MIASYSGNFIFIKTRKTGGTSVEVVLSSWCRGRDIVAPITPADELLRARYGGHPMNFCDDPAIEDRFRSVIAEGDVTKVDREYRAIRRWLRFTSHDPATKVRDELPDLWPRAFKFTIERHPYERVVSRVYWRIHHRKEGDLKRFDETMDEVLSESRLTNAKLYMDGDELLVDAVFDYDDMWRQIGLLAERTGNSLPDSLPRAKAGHRTDRRPAAEILTADQKRRIQHSCAIEFERFGYEP